MSPRTPADWSLPAASFSAPVLGSDQSACPVFENYILISRSSCPTYGVHFREAELLFKGAMLNGDMIDDLGDIKGVRCG
jgi:hypothetical protein